MLYTGGTIGMRQSEAGLVPDAALAHEALRPFVDEFAFDWHVCEPLIDSSAVDIPHWQSWLDLIQQKLPEYDGILMLHGTDTMAYTANVLALSILGLDKPIVLTGSQWPFNAENSDAPLNLATALAAFGQLWQGVAIAFNGKLYPAIGSSKVSTETAEGFANPHFGSIGAWSADSGWHEWRASIPVQHVQAAAITACHLEAKVAVYWLAPGYNAEMIAESLQATPANAVILMTYGHGNAPACAKLLAAVERFIAAGKPILNISQVMQGCAAEVYAQGSALRQAGVISGGKANIETALALLHIAVSRKWGRTEIEHCLLRHSLLAA